MNKFFNKIHSFSKRQRAATATEYIILLILIAILVISVVKSYGKVVQTKFKQAHDRVSSEVTWK